MPQKKVTVRYLGIERVPDVLEGEVLAHGYRYEVTLEQEAKLIAEFGAENIKRLEPSLEEVAVLEEKKPKPRAKKEEAKE